MIRLYDKEEKYFNHLGICSLDDCISCVSNEELNGKFEIEMKYPVNGTKFSQIEIGKIIYLEPNDVSITIPSHTYYQPFRIYAIETPISDSITIKAQHIFYDTLGLIVRPYAETTESTLLTNIISHVMNNIISAPNIAFVNSQASDRLAYDWLRSYDGSIYSPTEGDVRYILLQKDDPDYLKLFKWNGNEYELTTSTGMYKCTNNYFNIINNVDSSKAYGKKLNCENPMSVKDYLFTIIEKFKIDIYFDNFDIYLEERRGETKSSPITYGRNMVDFTQEENNNNAYSGIMPYYLGSTITNSKKVTQIRNLYHITSKDKFSYGSASISQGGVAVAPLRESFITGAYPGTNSDISLCYHLIDERQSVDPKERHLIVRNSNYAENQCWVRVPSRYLNIKNDGTIKNIKEGYEHCRIRRSTEYPYAPLMGECFQRYYNGQWYNIQPDSYDDFAITELEKTTFSSPKVCIFVDDYQRESGHESDPFDPDDEYAKYCVEQTSSGLERGVCYALLPKPDVIYGNLARMNPEGTYPKSYGKEQWEVIGCCVYLRVQIDRDPYNYAESEQSKMFSYTKDFSDQYKVDPNDFKDRCIVIIGQCNGVPESPGFLYKIYYYDRKILYAPYMAWYPFEASILNGAVTKLKNLFTEGMDTNTSRQFINFSMAEIADHPEIIIFEGHENDEPKKILKLDLTNEVKEITSSPDVNTLVTAVDAWLEKNEEKYSNNEIQITTGIIKESFSASEYVFIPGDIVPINFSKFNIHINKRILSIEYDCVKKQYSNIEIGEYDYEED